MSETKANLIFIVALLVLTVPGVSILFMKKLNSEGRSMMPPPRREEAAYMDPTPGELSLRRYVPQMTASFVQGTTRHNARSAGLLSIVDTLPWKPVTSERRFLQLVAHDPSPTANRYCFILWIDRPVPIESVHTWTATTSDGEKIVGDIEGLHTINLPPDLREELMEAGFIRPPTVIGWTQVKFPATTKLQSLDYTFVNGRNGATDRFDLSAINSTTKPTTSTTTRPQQ
jgi:hypothetical protein